MLKIGFDFDNTLVNYDNIFYELASEKGLINQNIKKNKVSVRNYLREIGREKDFTLMQGEIYGKKILEIKPCPELIKVLKKLICDGHEIFIISHKTKTPFIGPKYDLHEAATKWLETNKFFYKDWVNFNPANVYFEETLSKKIERISNLNCDVFIDDLPEVLSKLEKEILGIHYLYDQKFIQSGFCAISNWKELISIIRDQMKKKYVTH
tara:strand:+ start:711 stop:1337 length:627 start_codon:yes stop_codon:yes gene_type:complete